MTTTTPNLTSNEQLRLLREENERLKDDLFALMPHQDEVSDASIQQGFTDLCRSIDNWVEDINGDASREGAKSKQRRVVEARSRLLESEGVDQRLLRNRYGADHFILSIALRRLLHEHVFRRMCPIGITGSQAQVIDEVVESLERINLREERLRIDRWRSEAIKALTSRADFAEIQTHELRKLSRIIKRALSDLVFHDNVFDKHHRTLDEILDSTIKLHQSMRSSTAHYHLWYPDVTRPQKDQIYDATWIPKDLDKWINVRRPDRHMQPVHCLYPALVRLPDERDPALVLVNPVIVIDSPTHSEMPEASIYPQSFATDPTISPIMAEPESYDREREESRHSPRKTTTYKLTDGTTVRVSPQSSTISQSVRSDVVMTERQPRSKGESQSERKQERTNTDRRAPQKSPSARGWFWKSGSAGT